MKLLIHDMDENEWKLVAEGFEGWTVISDNGTIKPCGKCVSGPELPRPTVLRKRTF